MRDDEVDLGEEDEGATADCLADGITIPFPHEHHMTLCQEWLHTFRAEVLVHATPAGGLWLRAALLSNVRAIAIVRNPAHKSLLQACI